jgi:hypothetical protein
VQSPHPSRYLLEKIVMDDQLPLSPASLRNQFSGRGGTRLRAPLTRTEAGWDGSPRTAFGARLPHQARLLNLRHGQCAQPLRAGSLCAWFAERCRSASRAGYWS